MACKLASADHVPLMKQLGVRWLPGIVLSDAQERIHHQWVGFLPPADYRTELLFGRAMAAYGAKRYDEAAALFDRLVAEFSRSERAPEALYWRGVNEYRRTNGMDAPKEQWRRLVNGYPASLWSRKVEIFL